MILSPTSSICHPAGRRSKSLARDTGEAQFSVPVHSHIKPKLHRLQHRDSSPLDAADFLALQPDAQPSFSQGTVPVTGRRMMLVALASSALIGYGDLATAGPAEAALTGVSCPGLNGYALQQCLRELRKAREVTEAAADGRSDGGGSDTDAVREERLRYRQYEQPGTLVTLPNGLQYRELLEGTGPEATIGSLCEISYIVYRLSSGAYYKYSSGGTPVFLFSLGYGQEGKDDVGQTYRFRLGEAGSLPAAATLALVGMRQGGKRRVLVPPRLGWVDDKVGPRPDTFGGQRRLAGHKDEPLLFEAELIRVRQQVPEQSLGGALDDVPAGSRQGALFRLPAPPTYYGSGKV
ncbi:hypothetical protein Vretimale_11763 [Volvox reticuliferus]|uniref:peptidylprolyl isomerase n=1 Tax=Volvox reticuliferus TaxID=1737510 RepID=A0A8J4GI19_9CHLO|nr:hypothetical protein Vretifemale_20231 [Volvox reticuliferus]GIM07698.1 hypothetical protein Vretimale_11763 [Volvox reticuliferus]